MFKRDAVATMLAATTSAGHVSKDAYADFFGSIYSSVPSLIASNEASRGIGEEWLVAGAGGIFSYTEVAADGTFANAAGVQLKLVTEGLSSVTVGALGVFPQPLSTPNANLNDQTERLQAALNASASERFVLEFTSGKIGVSGPVADTTLPCLTATSGISMEGKTPADSRIVNLTPYRTLFASPPEGSGDLNISKIGFDGGWDRKLNGAGANWAFDASDAAFDDIYGVHIQLPTSSSDPNNNISDIEIENVAGIGWKREGRGGDFVEKIRIQGCARWGMYHDNQQDLHMQMLDVSLCGLGGFYLDGGSHKVEGGKFWFIGMATEGNPDAAVRLADAGTGTHTIKGFAVSDCAGTAVRVQGRNNYIQFASLSSGALGETGGDRTQAWGNTSLNLKNFALVHLSGGSDNTIEITSAHDKTLEADETSVIRLARFSSQTNNNIIRVSPYASRIGLITKPYNDDLFFEDGNVSRLKGGNIVELMNGSLLLNHKKTGLNTMIVMDDTDTFNFSTSRGVGTRRWCDDIRRHVVYVGDYGWVIDGTEEKVKTEVQEVSDDPATVTLTVGHRYLIGPNPVNGLWNGHANHVATYFGGDASVEANWSFAVPLDGHTLTDLSGPTVLTYNGTTEVWA